MNFNWAKSCKSEGPPQQSHNHISIFSAVFGYVQLYVDTVAKTCNNTTITTTSMKAICPLLRFHHVLYTPDLLYVWAGRLARSLGCRRSVLRRTRRCSSWQTHFIPLRPCCPPCHHRHPQAGGATRRECRGCLVCVFFSPSNSFSPL